MANVVSEVHDCPKCKGKLRVNITWKEKCNIDYNKKEHKPNIDISKIELYGGD